MPHHNCTFHGLHDWSSHMFEKLGWMLLAKRNKNTDSVRCYIKGLKRLHDEISHKYKETQDPDRKRDLEELSSNVLYLTACAQHMLLSKTTIK